MWEAGLGVRRGLGWDPRKDTHDKGQTAFSLAAATTILGGLGAYRWHHPCPDCPISMVIGAWGSIRVCPDFQIRLPRR